MFIGDTLPEYTVLGFPTVTQACYVVCPGCKTHQDEEPEVRAFYEEMDRQYEKELQDRSDQTAGPEAETVKKEHPSRPESMTDATTVEGSEDTTSAVGIEGWRAPFSKG